MNAIMIQPNVTAMKFDGTNAKECEEFVGNGNLIQFYNSKEAKESKDVSGFYFTFASPGEGDYCNSVKAGDWIVCSGDEFTSVPDYFVEAMI